MTTTVLGRFAALAVVLASAAQGDSIDPERVEMELPLEQTTVIEKTVTVTKGAPRTATVDVVLLSDTTGSMASVINQVRNNAASILRDFSVYGSVRYGAAEYRDFTEAYAHRTNAELTASIDRVRAGIAQWQANGGGDNPEANLYGLGEVATKTRWREQSTRIILWFGDAPGHDPSGSVTTQGLIRALNRRGIVVHAFNSGSLDSSGQASRITRATGGRLWSVSRTDGVAAAIIGAVGETLQNYSEVRLDFGDEPLGLGIEITPESYSGDFKRDRDRTYTFEMKLEAFKPGSYDFNVDAMVDGTPVARETDQITVPNRQPVREASD